MSTSPDTAVTYTSTEILSKLRALLEDITYAPDSAADLVEDLIFEVESDESWAEVNNMSKDQLDAFLLEHGYDQKRLDEMRARLVESLKLLPPNPRLSTVQSIP